MWLQRSDKEAAVLESSGLLKGRFNFSALSYHAHTNNFLSTFCTYIPLYCNTHTHTHPHRVPICLSTHLDHKTHIDKWNTRSHLQLTKTVNTGVCLCFDNVWYLESSGDPLHKQDAQRNTEKELFFSTPNTDSPDPSPAMSRYCSHPTLSLSSVQDVCSIQSLIV